MDNQDKLYEQFKDAARKAETKDFARMEAVWNRVEEKLDHKELKKKASLWKYTGIAATLLLFMGAGFFLLSNENNTPVTTPKARPENTVTVIDTQKVEKTLNPATIENNEAVVTTVNPTTTEVPYAASSFAEPVTPQAQKKKLSKGYTDAVTAAPAAKSSATVNREMEITPVSADALVAYENANVKIVNPDTTSDKTTTADETVVESYSTITKATSNVAVASFAAKTIEGRPNANFVQSLQGQVPGLNVTTGSGQPQANSLVSKTTADFPSIPPLPYIFPENKEKRQLEKELKENHTTILKSIPQERPLIFVDNLLVSYEGVQKINTDHIATIDVLKDSTATAPYGETGKNGIIKISIKKQYAKKVKKQLIRFNKKQEKLHKKQPENYLRFRQEKN